MDTVRITCSTTRRRGTSIRGSRTCSADLRRELPARADVELAADKLRAVPVVRAAAAEVRERAAIRPKDRSSPAAIRPRAVEEVRVVAVEEAPFLLRDNRACPGTCRSSR